MIKSKYILRFIFYFILYNTY